MTETEPGDFLLIESTLALSEVCTSIRLGMDVDSICAMQRDIQRFRVEQ